ncbi:MAG: hypothetical protein JSS01_07805 [Proteobacteria bacterium]|nr:hypothetical protein [Pseudomonadota bacterium]
MAVSSDSSVLEHALRMNAIQSQHGLLLCEFHLRYGNEQPCAAALVVARRPHGRHCVTAWLDTDRSSGRG